MVGRSTARAATKAGPDRRTQLLKAAERLFATRGYHAVGINDIGAELHLTGPAIYRYFPSKDALLVAVFEDVISDNLAEIREIVAATRDPAEALKAVLTHHIEFVFDQTQNLITWRHESRHLPPEDSARLRRLQRLYMKEWTQIIAALAPDLSDAHVRAVAFAAVSVLQSPTDFPTELDRGELTEVLYKAALAAIRAGLQRPRQPAAHRRRTRALTERALDHRS